MTLRAIVRPFAFVAAACLAGPALAADPVVLPKDEVQKALSGKSMTYESRGGSSTTGAVTLFFSSDGRFTLKFPGNARTSSGTWSVDDDGRYCIKIISGTASDGCRHLLKTDTGYALKTGRGEIVTIDKLE